MKPIETIPWGKVSQDQIRFRSRMVMGHYSGEKLLSNEDVLDIKRKLGQ
jgi:hypothetical protein